MLKRVCDNCQEPIWNGSIYYLIKLISNENGYFNDHYVEICAKCAEKLKVSDTNNIN